MIKVQITNDFGKFELSEIMKNGVYLEPNELNGLLIYAKNVLYKEDDVIFLKKGTEVILTDSVRDILAFDIVLTDNITLTLATNINDFSKVNDYHIKFIKSVIRHNKQYGEIKRDEDVDKDWESFLDTMLCLRDEDGQRPCDFCTNKCNEEWVNVAYEHYLDMKTYALPVTEEA